MDSTRSRSLPDHPVEELAPQTYCQRAALELAALVRHQRKPRHHIRRDSALLRRCVEQVINARSKSARSEGPWKVGHRPLKRPGRGGMRFIPMVIRGSTAVMLSTAEEAEELAAFLNYCGTEELGS